MLAFQSKQILVRLWCWIVLDIQDVGQLCRPHLRLKERDELMCLTRIAVEWFCCEVKEVNAAHRESERTCVDRLNISVGILGIL